MSTRLQHRRGSTAAHSTFTGADGEITVDQTKKTAVVHDNATAGGIPLAREDHVHNATAIVVTPSGLLRDTAVSAALATLHLKSPRAKTRTVATPPATPAIGDVHIVAAGSTGAWNGQDTKFAVCSAPSPSVAWVFVAPTTEQPVYSEEDHSHYYWNGTAWTATGSGVADNSISMAKLTAQLAGYVHVQNWSNFA